MSGQGVGWTNRAKSLSDSPERGYGVRAVFRVSIPPTGFEHPQLEMDTFPKGDEFSNAALLNARRCWQTARFGP